MSDIWPKNVERMEREEERIAADKAAPRCTCAGSPFGMDVDRCPVHRVGCA